MPVVAAPGCRWWPRPGCRWWLRPGCARTPVVARVGGERRPPRYPGGVSDPTLATRAGADPARPDPLTPPDVDAVAAALEEHGYIADEGLATSIFLALVLHRPLLLEGEAGVGKTEVAKVLSAWTGGDLLRLQCYEGIDVSQAVYEWDYARQLLHLRASEVAGERAASNGRPDGAAAAEPTDAVYSERFLVRRPLLQAIDHGDGPPPVLLIDEVDRADDEFEAFLLEILSEYAVTVPELGTFHAAVPPRVIITSNRTRDVHDALKRRCLYHWVPHPDFEREVAIVRLRAPQAAPVLARQVAAAVEALRGMQLYKPPGVAETIDWATALAALGRATIDERTLDVTLGTVLKYQEDQNRVRAAGIGELVRAAVLRGA
ncbi:AAA domain-containing protein [Acidimicrobiaceae bacterium USS-CC1]|uniref:AAA domain-containing protein n=1 Tax=Acidiferrimicrobium australe TaxID=2664430 RepID=A0ABW9QYY3_9ACTN|nr:AAA domain-containing protein [Acidiferrimicrobium australe]